MTWLSGCKNWFYKTEQKREKMKLTPIDFQWPTLDPFLFCVHHFDHYPTGNDQHGLDAKHFLGRNMGSDFMPKDGFRIYHGQEIPGFPVHPHRGFETITIVRKGYVDHADSLGAAGRYGEGDVQWLTAGSGIQHSEMFPLLHKDKENTLELFQIWINLPKANKMVPADFKMLWSEKIPKIKKDNYEVTLISGEFEDQTFYQAPKDSWAAKPENNVNILLVNLKEGAEFKYPKAKQTTNRVLYFFGGDKIIVNGEEIAQKSALYPDSDQDLVLKTSGNCEVLILEAKPIAEPVVQHGPFVMNSKAEIVQTFEDYQKTQFGGWSWDRTDMIHGSETNRFAKYPNGKIEKPI